MKVYFGKSKENRELIGEGKTSRQCSQIVSNYIEENKLPSAPYRRFWEAEKEIVIDYGSHSNFFFIDDAKSYHYTA